MYYNNRQPVYRQKKYVKRKVIHTEVKDGVTIFVEGKKTNPYEGVPCSSLSLDARIETGVYQKMEGAPRHLEKAQGSDIMTQEIEAAQRDYESRKEAAIEEEKSRKAAEQYKKDKEELNIKD